MSRRRTDRPAPSTIRSRRSREVQALGYLIDRVTYPADALRLLVAGGYIPDRVVSDCDRQAREVRQQAIADFLAVALSALEAEIMQHVANPGSVSGHSLQRRRVR